MELNNLEKVEEVIEIGCGQLLVCAGDGYLWKGTENNLTLVDENDDFMYAVFNRLSKY